MYRPRTLAGLHAPLPTLLRAGAWALVAAAALAGCSDLGEPIRLGAHAELSVASLDFGTVAVSASATRSVIVGNSGGADLHGSASIACANYSIQSGGGAFTVPAGGQHTVVVAYMPSDTGPSNCQLDLGAGIPSVSLTGAGALQAPGAQCQLSVPSLAFAATAVGGSAQSGYTISNTGTAPLILNVVASCNDFVVLVGGGPSTLPPGGALAVTIEFVPRTGGAISCSIANGPGCPEVAVSGTATSVSFASDIRPILTTTCAFGCHFFGSTSAIVNVPGAIYPDYTLVIPSDPAHSLIFIKITGPPPELGRRMPEIGLPLSAAQIDKFRRWILEGALDN
jgi:hypothetical protein